MLYFITIYLVGCLGNMAMFYHSNKSKDYYSKVDLDLAISISVLSWIVLIAMLLYPGGQRLNEKFRREL